MARRIVIRQKSRKGRERENMICTICTEKYIDVAFAIPVKYFSRKQWRKIDRRGDKMEVNSVNSSLEHEEFRVEKLHLKHHRCIKTNLKLGTLIYWQLSWTISAGQKDDWHGRQLLHTIIAIDIASLYELHCEIQMDFMWTSCGLHVDYMWTTCGLHVNYMWTLCGFHIWLYN